MNPSLQPTIVTPYTNIPNHPLTIPTPPSLPSTPTHLPLPQINIGSSHYPFISHNNTGYIQAKDFEIELNNLRPKLSPTLKEIVLDTIALRYALPSHIPDLLPTTNNNQFILMLKIEDALKALSLSTQFNDIYNGLHLFSSQTGTINITHKNYTITTPFIHMRDGRSIPTIVIPKLKLPMIDSVPTTILRKWERAQLLMQNYMLSTTNDSLQLPSILEVICIDSLSSKTGIHFQIEYHQYWPHYSPPNRLLPLYTPSLPNKNHILHKKALGNLNDLPVSRQSPTRTLVSVHNIFLLPKLSSQPRHIFPQIHKNKHPRFLNIHRPHIIHKYLHTLHRPLDLQTAYYKLKTEEEERPEAEDDWSPIQRTQTHDPTRMSFHLWVPTAW